MMDRYRNLAISAVSALSFLCGALPRSAEAAPCAPEVYAALRLPASAQTQPLEIACDLSLSGSDIVTMPVAFSGSAASGATLDCQGGVLDGTVARARTVLVRSIRRPDGHWDAPHDVSIRNCTINGDVRIQGLGANGEAEEVRLSSLSPGHTARAQAAAPGRIMLDNITFVANGAIPLYVAPGVTEVTVRGSRFSGRTTSTAVYLDAESARNRITGNLFDIQTSMREMIAVDGSADNIIDGNIFENPLGGGVFLYRNCGEGGTIRHQAPQRNIISGNTFRYLNFWAARPAVWLGSRQGARAYCFSSPDSPFGSGVSAMDYARYNSVVGNRLPGGTARLIVDQDENNTVVDNR